MATQVQLRRGTTAEHSTFTGVVGEVTIDTDKDALVVHDNSQAGGYPVASLHNAQEYSAAQNFNATTLTDGATINWDASANQVTSVTLGGNRTFAAPTNMVDGGAYVLIVVQDGTGSRTITWNSVFKWVGGTAPTLTTANGSRDQFVFVSNGTNMYEIGRALDVK